MTFETEVESVGVDTAVAPAVARMPTPTVIATSFFIIQTLQLTTGTARTYCTWPATDGTRVPLGFSANETLEPTIATTDTAKMINLRIKISSLLKQRRLIT